MTAPELLTGFRGRGGHQGPAESKIIADVPQKHEVQQNQVTWWRSNLWAQTDRNVRVWSNGSGLRNIPIPQQMQFLTLA
jgi:hypothetical protein